MNTAPSTLSPKTSSSTSAVLDCITELNNIQLNLEKEEQRKKEEERLALAKKLQLQEEAERERQRIALIEAAAASARQKAQEEEERRKHEAALQRAVAEAVESVERESTTRQQLAADSASFAVVASVPIPQKRSWALGAAALLLSICSLALVTSAMPQDDSVVLVVKRPMLMLETIEKTVTVVAAETVAPPVSKTVAPKQSTKAVEASKTTPEKRKKPVDEACRRDPLCNINASGLTF
jgi:hypothetical protein